jgi:hypothetical protein
MNRAKKSERVDVLAIQGQDLFVERGRVVQLASSMRVQGTREKCAGVALDRRLVCQRVFGHRGVSPWVVMSAGYKKYKGLTIVDLRIGFLGCAPRIDAYERSCKCRKGL